MQKSSKEMEKEPEPFSCLQHDGSYWIHPEYLSIKFGKMPPLKILEFIAEATYKVSNQIGLFTGITG
jgi:hypothetical protein